jgi:peptidoglycan hydrolase-like protein with peptidoglycan-binding domain
MIAGGVLVVAVAASGTWYALSSRTTTTAAAPKPTGVTTIKRQNLVQTEQDDGTLGYDDQRTLPAGGSGTVTWLPDEGRTVKRGQTLYRVDGKPVTLMLGPVPMYRTLAHGVDDGADVKQLERNLEDLGYDPGTVDDHFSSATRSAVEDGQDDRGLSSTGRVDASQVVFLPWPTRIGAHVASVGDAVGRGRKVTGVSSTTRIATVELRADHSGIAVVGGKVQIELPTGTTVAGTITDVSKVTKAGTASGATTSDATVEVTVRVDHPASTGDLEGGPVTVDFARDHRDQVLAVPVAALVELADGGYAVEVVRTPSSQLVRVRTGLFAGDQVEISAAGLRAGDQVVVAQ